MVEIISTKCFFITVDQTCISREVLSASSLNCSEIFLACPVNFSLEVKRLRWVEVKLLNWVEVRTLNGPL